jgi:hypothetical protein
MPTPRALDLPAGSRQRTSTRTNLGFVIHIWTIAQRYALAYNSKLAAACANVYTDKVIVVFLSTNHGQFTER